MLEGSKSSSGNWASLFLLLVQVEVGDPSSAISLTAKGACQYALASLHVNGNGINDDR